VRSLSCASSSSTAAQDTSSVNTIARRVSHPGSLKRDATRLSLSLRCGFRPLHSCSQSLVAKQTADAQRPPERDTASGPGETINGTERIGWLQRAADAVGTRVREIHDLGGPGARSELTGRVLRCLDGGRPTAFSCSARLPTLSAGAPQRWSCRRFGRRRLSVRKRARSSPLARHRRNSCRISR